MKGMAFLAASPLVQLIGPVGDPRVSPRRALKPWAQLGSNPVLLVPLAGVLSDHALPFSCILGNSGQTSLQRVLDCA